MVNRGEKELRNLEFEVNMLPMQERESAKEELQKVRTKYNQARMIYFQVEDNLNNQVLKVKATGIVGDTRNQRQRQLDGVMDLYD